MRLGNTPATAPGLRGARRVALLSLAAAAFLGGCGGDRDADDQAGTSPPAAVNPAPPDGGPAEAPPAGAPVPAAPMTVEDSIRIARDDSIALAKDYHQRIGSMESYANCMQKTKGADPQVRPVLEAACRRARGAPR